MEENRIDRRMARLRAEGRPALVTYLMAGDPDHDTSLSIMKALPAAGVDMIELGMPFSDPMADGPAIQAAGLRALKGGQTLERTLAMAAAFRRSDDETPVVMMGYYNPIYVYGVERFLDAARKSGIDGLIVVDLPPEMDDELCIPAARAGVAFIRLVAPTTRGERLRAILENARGFVYCVSVAGTTGGAAADPAAVRSTVADIRKATPLPIFIGFGIRTGSDVRSFAAFADGVVVGTAMVEAIAGDGRSGSPVGRAQTLVRELRAS